MIKNHSLVVLAFLDWSLDTVAVSPSNKDTSVTSFRGHTSSISHRMVARSLRCHFSSLLTPLRPRASSSVRNAEFDLLLSNDFKLMLIIVNSAESLNDQLKWQHNS